MSAAWSGVTSACDRFSSPDLCVPPTFLPGLVHVFVSCGRVVSSVKKPNFLGVKEEMFWVMMVNVCACGPGQQHFSGCQELVQLLDVVLSIHRATSVGWLKSWVGQVLKAFHQPLAHKNREDSFSEERLSDWLRRIKSVNKEQPV